MPSKSEIVEIENAGCSKCAVELTLISIIAFSDWFKACQASAVLAFVCNTVALVTLILFAFVVSLPEKPLKITTLVLLVFAGAFLGRARPSRDGLIESYTCRPYHCVGPPHPDPETP